MTITGLTIPGWLSLSDNGDGTATLSGTPQAGDVGQHSVTLQVSDGTAFATQPFSVTDSATTSGVTPHLSITKTVSGVGGSVSDLALGSVVTYTISLANSGDGAATGVVMTDALPAGVTFAGFVNQNNAQEANNTITWSGAVSAGVVVSLEFRAAVTSSGQFSSLNAGSGEDSAGFSLASRPAQHLIYLPVIMK